MAMNVAVGPYLADILEQPAALRAVYDRRRDYGLTDRLGPLSSYDRILLTGMGASIYALRPAWMTLAAAGAPAWLIETGQLLHDVPQLITGRTLVIAASQSGHSAELVSLGDSLSPRTTLVALTNDLESPLAGAAHATVDIHAGQEHAVSTRSYVNTLAAAALTIETLTGRNIDPRYDLVADDLEAYLVPWRERLETIARLVGVPERLYLLARGTSLAAAGCGALVLKEAAKWPAEGMSCPQFRHGPLELADERLTTIILAGDDPDDRRRNRRLHDDLNRLGAFAIWADDTVDPAVSTIELAHAREFGRPIVEIVALQLLSVAIAEQTNTPPGTFRHLDKVTTIE
jgi:glucosamine--fructose-6-phosphate aminotransferase (isomerizing)